jgi:hypothetical protein
VWGGGRDGERGRRRERERIKERERGRRRERERERERGKISERLIYTLPKQNLCTIVSM